MALEGILNQVSVGVESTYGTAVTPTLSIPIKPSNGITIAQEVKGVEAINTSAPKNKAFFKGKREYKGGYSFDLYPQFAGYFLKSAMGGLTTTEVETGVVYKHTFIEDTSKASLTVEQVVGDISKRFAGYVVNSFKLSGKVGEPVDGEVEGMAKTQADSTKITASYETGRIYTYQDATISIAGTDISAKASDFEFEYNNGLEMFYGFGDVEPATKYVKNSEAKGKVTLYVDTATKSYLQNLMDATESEVIITLTGASIGSSSNDKLVITMSKCAFTAVATNLDVDVNAMSIDFEAREDSTNGLVKMELTNTVSTY